jgi:RNA polymerase sigma factor (sigma-70 family)
VAAQAPVVSPSRLPLARPSTSPYNPGMPTEPFEPTNWSLILAARDRASPRAREALSALCQAYWYPLYAFIRRQGHSADAAEDLTQEFFARFLETDFLAAVDRDKGRFRAFLLAACKHFLANRRDHDKAQIRGGAHRIVSIDTTEAEGRYRLEPVHHLTPEALFERRWALTLLDQVFEQLRHEFDQAGKSDQFEALKSTLTGDRCGVPYARIAERLGTTEGAVQVAAHRLRRRYRAALRARIAATVDDPARIDDEIRDLFAALGP